MKERVITSTSVSIGERVVLTAPGGGDHYRWTFVNRLGNEESWPFDIDPHDSKVEIPSWGRHHHGTYYVEWNDAEGADRRIAQTIPPSIRLAFSGGGFRASLFSAGAALYFADADANYRVEDISSVSGGSILSAFLEEHIDYPNATPEEVRHAVAAFADRATRSWWLGGAWELPNAALAIGWLLPRTLLFAAALVGAQQIPWDWMRQAAIYTVFVAAALLFLHRGRIVELMLRRRMEIKSSVGEHRRYTSHVYCATDLINAEPIFFGSTHTGSFVYSRRRGLAPSTIKLSTAVRASSALPIVFFPVKVALPPAQAFITGLEGFKYDDQVPNSKALCADGGVANNLGTQWHEENTPGDWPYRLASRLPGWQWRPGREFVHITIDASKPAKPSKNPLLSMWAINELFAFFRTTSVMYLNTIEPRRTAESWVSNYLGQTKADEVGRRWQRGSHQRILVSIDPFLPQRLKDLVNTEYPVPIPTLVSDRAFCAVTLELERIVELMRYIARQPTTLFRLSKQQVGDCILTGYLATLLSTYVFEGIAPNLWERVVARLADLQSLGAREIWPDAEEQLMRLAAIDAHMDEVRNALGDPADA